MTVQHKILKPRTIFLIDGIGALVSTILLFTLLAPFEHFFGIAKVIIHALSIPAIVFTLYSLSCYCLNIKNWKPYLTLIALANGLYCCMTAYFILSQLYFITVWGLLYFLGEIIVISFIIKLEIKAIRQEDVNKINI